MSEALHRGFRVLCMLQRAEGHAVPLRTGDAGDLAFPELCAALQADTPI